MHPSWQNYITMMMQISNISSARPTQHGPTPNPTPHLPPAPTTTPPTLPAAALLCVVCVVVADGPTGATGWCAPGDGKHGAGRLLLAPLPLCTHFAHHTGPATRVGGATVRTRAHRRVDPSGVVTSIHTHTHTHQSKQWRGSLLPIGSFQPKVPASYVPRHPHCTHRAEGVPTLTHALTPATPATATATAMRGTIE